MLIENVLNLIEEYTAFKQLPRLVKARKIASAPTMANSQQRSAMQTSMKSDGKMIAKQSVRLVGDSIVPGLGTAAVASSDVAHLIKRSTRQNGDGDSHEIVDTVPTNTISHIIRNRNGNNSQTNIQDSVKQDAKSLAKKSAQYLGDTLIPGLGTAGIVGSDVTNLVKTSANRNNTTRPSAIADTVPTNTASTMIRNKVQNARSQHVLDHINSKDATEIQQGRVQKICAQNPGLKGC